MLLRASVCLLLELAALVGARPNPNIAPPYVPCKANGVTLCRNVPYRNAPLQLFAVDKVLFDRSLPIGTATTDENGRFSLTILRNTYFRITHKCPPPYMNLRPGCWMETFITAAGIGEGCQTMELPPIHLDHERTVEKCG